MSTQENTPTRRRLRRGLTAAGLVAGGIVIGASGLALAGGGMGPMGPMGPMGSMGWHHHHRGGVGALQHRVRGTLDDVGATTAQEDKVHDIIAAASTQLDREGNPGAEVKPGVLSRPGDEGKAGGEGMRRQILELMKAPTLDRAAFETLRAKKVAEMEAKSKVVSSALFDAASQLTPDQRAKLADRFEARMDRGWSGHRRDGGERGERRNERGDMDRGGMDRGGERAPGGRD